MQTNGAATHAFNDTHPCADTSSIPNTPPESGHFRPPAQRSTEESSSLKYDLSSGLSATDHSTAMAFKYNEAQQRIRIQFEVELDIPKNHYGLLFKALVRSFGNITLIQAARMVGLSRSEFSRTFASDCGVSFRSACHQVRLYAATVFLTDTSLRIGDIASSLGYDSLLTFERGFRRWHGVSPSEYRQRGEASQVLIFRTSSHTSSALRDGTVSVDLQI